MYRLGRGVTKSKRKRIALIKCIGDGPFARRVLIRVFFFGFFVCLSQRHSSYLWCCGLEVSTYEAVK